VLWIARRADTVAFAKRDVGAVARALRPAIVGSGIIGASVIGSGIVGFGTIASGIIASDIIGCRRRGGGR